MSNTDPTPVTSEVTDENGDVVQPKAYKSTVNQRRGHRSYVTKVLKQVEDILRYFDEERMDDLRGKKMVLMEKLNTLEHLDEEVMGYLSDEEVIGNEIEQCSDIRGRIHDCLVRIDSKLERRSDPPTTPHSWVSDSQRKENIAKLPKLTLESFGGDPIEFHTWWDNFKTAVHENDSIAKAMKFNYLRSYLHGSARSSIEGLTLTSGNYDEAIKIIRERFANEQLLVTANIDKLLSLPAVHSINNVKCLREIYNKIETYSRNLSSLQVERGQYGPVLISIIMSKLPQEIKLQISRCMPVNNKWDVDDLLKNLKQEIDSREMCFQMSHLSSGGKANSLRTENSEKKNHPDEYQSTGSTLLNTRDSYEGDRFNRPISCTYCRGSHKTSKCDVITDVSARKAILRRKGRCFVCLRGGHIIKYCKSTFSCYKCNGRHHISICEEPMKKGEGPNADSKDGAKSGQYSGVTTTQKSTTLLQTAQANLIADNGKSKTVRLLFDSCSQKSYINDGVRQQLNLPLLRRERVTVKAFESTNEEPRVIDVVQAKVQGINKPVVVNVELYVVPRICSPISSQTIELAQATYNHIIDLNLADSTNGSPNLKIDVLIGGDVYWKFITGEFRRGKSGPVAINTVVGWVLSGECDWACDTISTNLVSSHVLMIDCEPEVSSRDKEIIETVNKFWDVEDIISPETSDHVEKEFLQSVKFDNSRYTVKLPWKVDPEILPDNYSLAKACLNSLFKRLSKSPKKLNEYNEIIRNQELEGIVENVDPIVIPEVGRTHYIPHREVVKEQRDTTKMRIVYNASARRKGCISLNDALESGPCMLPKIFDILVRFRSYKYAIISDINSAFLQIRIAGEDRNYLRFLWVDDISKEDPHIIVKRFTSVPFGLTSSPFLLNATIAAHMKQYCHINETFVKQFLRDLYMDDNISGTQNINEGFEYYLFCKSTMLQGGFELRKWQSNSTELLVKIREHEKHHFQNTEEISKNKVLGQIWNCKDDGLVFKLDDVINAALQENSITKRLVLKTVASIYDPLGVMSPSIVQLKTLFQEVCALKCDWDTSLSNEIIMKWTKILMSLKKIDAIVLPRHYLVDLNLGDVHKMELHGFSDASKIAVAAVIYIRVQMSNKVIFTNIVASKTRITPLKNNLTIPKLELVGCEMMSKLMKTVLSSLESVYTVNDVFCWTDALDCLHWVTNSSKVWPRFVQNRVVKIRNNSPSVKWRHCPGKENPADIPSRGLDIGDEETRKKWLFGADFLTQDESFWPRIPNVEMSTDVAVNTVASDDSSSNDAKEINLNDVIDSRRYNDLQKLLRVTSYVLRFISNIKLKIAKSRLIKSELTYGELDEAKKIWILNEQNAVNSDKKLMKNLVNCLGIFKDVDGLLKLKGRLQESDLTSSAKYPIFLSRESYFTELVILDCHFKVKHLKVRDTLNELRSSYWVPQGRRTVKRVIRPCITCNKQESKPFKSLPAAPLPDFRAKADFPFTSTGVDYLGPLLVKNIFKPEKEMFKVHVVLYTCATSRAVHLDLVPNPTCLAFVRSLKRFIGRRGISRLYISDNAGCFTGPELNTFIQQIQAEWKFILQASPWWGGFWERLVQSVKRCLRKTLGKSKLNYEELLTVVIEIEGVLNSRPLCYIYDDELDEVITPSHLMFGRRLLTTVDTDVDPETVEFTESSLGRKMKQVNKLVSCFWNSWKREYLTGLREFQKCRNRVPSRQIKLGEMVLVEDKLPRSKWKMGVVNELYKGRDGHVRGCKLRIVSRNNKVSYLNRPISRLYPMEVFSSNS